jgi:hypothetical protein
MALTCPKCRESNIRRSHRRPGDILFRVLGLVAFRCNVCDHRFFRLRSRARLSPEQVAAENLHGPQPGSF